MGCDAGCGDVIEVRVISVTVLFSGGEDDCSFVNEVTSGTDVAVAGGCESVEFEG